MHKEIKNYILILVALFAALGVIYVFEKLPGYIARKERDRILSQEVAVTIPEGLNAGQIGDILEKVGLFPKSEFTALAQSEEGYLFPDTYRFYKKSKPESVIAKMKNNFNKKVPPEALTRKDVIIMASILEEEAKSREDKKLVAGILWKRLKNGIGLQVDSATSTYRYRGLTPAPISNPGLDAILAALYPTASPYLYYLSDIRGGMHYAKTYEEHFLYKERYFR